MNIKRIASIAIIAALPFAANAENISGNMYTAPLSADANHPAPITGAEAPYGRVNIDTADQEHIATTAYVKGAYNSAIAGLNSVEATKQHVLMNVDDGVHIDPEVYGEESFGDLMQEINSGSSLTDIFGEFDDQLVTLRGVASGIQTYVSGRGVEIYTTWDDNDTTTVGFVPLAQN